jgi:hypothetical protein
MTKEQVAELVSRTDEGCYEGEGINVTKADVLRVLDEREALLEALRDAAELIDLYPTGDSSDARAALAKAEAP